MRNLVAALTLIGGALAAVPAHADDSGVRALALNAAAVQQAGFAASDHHPLAPAAMRAGAEAFRLAAPTPREGDGAAALLARGAGPVAGAPVQLGPAPAPAGPGLLDHAPRVGLFDLTFASDMPASGNDPMFYAEVVVALTHRF